MTKLITRNCSISLDLDNQWTYMKTHGDQGWQNFPSYLDVIIPRVLSFLEKHDLRITFFIVGQDAAFDKNKEALSMIPLAGHEIGNHSFHHEPWLHLYRDEDVLDEIINAEKAIESATGVRPYGFRGPGFSLSKTVLETLQQRNYKYDASTFPTFLGPLARAYYFSNTKLSNEEREQRKYLFGKFSEGFRPIRPYNWQLERGELTEIPVTTMPILRIPFHMSYLIYLASYSTWLAKLYFQFSLRACLFTKTEPSFLLHPLDFLGKDDIPSLSFFPGMNLSAHEKLLFMDDIFSIFKVHYNIMTMGEHADAIIKHYSLKEIVFDVT